MVRFFLVFYLVCGMYLCHGQEVRLPIYDDLGVMVDYVGDGKYMVDSMDMVKLLELARSLKAEAVKCDDVVRVGGECDSLLSRSMVLVSAEREVWSKRVELQTGRGDWYMERMKEEAKRGRGIGIRNAIIGACSGLVVGFVVGRVTP